MGRFAIALAFVLAAPHADAQTPAVEDDDDPAFARQAATPAAEEPVPEPLPYTEEDPGFSPAAAAPTGTALRARARRRAPPADDAIGIGVRFAYKTVAIPEPSAPPLGGVEPPFQDDRFHGL